MKHILVPTDFSESSIAAFAAVRQQIAKLDKTQFQLTILYVVEDMPAATFHFSLGEDTSALWAELDQQAQARLDQLAHEHFADLLPTATVIEARAGYSVADEIVDFAHSHRVSLVIMGSHGRRGFNRIWNGSVTERIVSRLPCPVLVVPPPAET